MYGLRITRRAQKALANLPALDQGRVNSAILDLIRQPRPVGCIKLTGGGGWRIRIGDYRVIYEIDDAERTVTVLSLGHRRDVYR